MRLVETRLAMRMTTTMWNKMKYSFAAWWVTRAKPSGRSRKLRNQTFEKLHGSPELQEANR